MKKSTRVTVTFSSINGDIYISDGRTFGWCQKLSLETRFEKDAYLALLAASVECVFTCDIQDDDLHRRLWGPAQWVHTIVWNKSFHYLRVVDSLNPDHGTGRHKATSIRNLMRISPHWAPELYSYPFRGRS